ncbi:hypothetical protein [Candidatus Neptunichlamydia sp. REUL1]|uniref:hypothetical protein n=1 Tax=Candidatus Neptunichlamydia sp. REUL1 TaxID=3064277 RepID=UPI00292DE74E|nr:hypothetical protein [Candidatus Neptunochlamydia sp. REUL1]
MTDSIGAVGEGNNLYETFTDTAERKEEGIPGVVSNLHVNNSQIFSKLRLCPQSLHHMMIEANKSAPLNIQPVLS